MIFAKLFIDPEFFHAAEETVNIVILASARSATAYPIDPRNPSAKRRAIRRAWQSRRVFYNYCIDRIILCNAVIYRRHSFRNRRSNIGVLIRIYTRSIRNRAYPTVRLNRRFSKSRKIDKILARRRARPSANSAQNLRRSAAMCVTASRQCIRSRFSLRLKFLRFKCTVYRIWRIKSRRRGKL